MDDTLKQPTKGNSRVKSDAIEIFSYLDFRSYFETDSFYFLCKILSIFISKFTS